MPLLVSLAPMLSSVIVVVPRFRLRLDNTTLPKITAMAAEPRQQPPTPRPGTRPIESCLHAPTEHRHDRLVVVDSGQSRAGRVPRSHNHAGRFNRNRAR
jgi:hypothetical protein